MQAGFWTDPSPLQYFSLVTHESFSIQTIAEEDEDPTDPNKVKETFMTPGPDAYVVGDVGNGDEMTIQEAKPGTYPKIIACATMWHETKDEMIACLKSIFRIDMDQCARRNALNYLGIEEEDYYDYESKN